MTTRCTTLPGIVEVRWLDGLQLSPNLEAKHMAGLPIAVLTETVPLKIFGLGELQRTDEHESNGRQSKATLTFRTLEDLPSNHTTVWVARQADGRYWLLGTCEAPYPTVKVTYQGGSPEGEPAVKTVEITHVGINAMLPVSL